MVMPGDKVRHPKAPEWGLGKVLEISSEGTALVYFLHTGIKRLDLAYAALEKTETGYHPILDHPTFPLRAKGRLPWALPEVRLAFLDLYPHGFEDESYLKQERRQKEWACHLLKDRLDERSFRALLVTESFSEIRSRVMEILGYAKLASKSDMQTLLQALRTPEHLEHYAEELFTLLYGHRDGGNQDFESRFNRFAACLKSIDASRWTLATCLPALMAPERHLCFTESFLPVAEMLRGDLEYDPEPNWPTYSRLQEFAAHLRAELSAMGMPPRDMLDVQAFVSWTVHAAVER